MSEAMREAFEALDNLRRWADDHPAHIEADVERWTKAVKAALSGAQQGVAESAINEALESGGWWASCSGCHETNEGVSDGPRSIFGCHSGSGCHECGGIGVIWHESPTDEQLAILAAEPDTAPQPAQVPEGWRLVPVEPTTEMLGEGAIALFAQSREPLSSAYRNMLAAAPRCPMLTAAPSGDASLAETARAFDAAPDDAEFGPDHPVFKLAAERDALLFRVRELESGDAKREAEDAERWRWFRDNAREAFFGHDIIDVIDQSPDRVTKSVDAARLRQSSDGDDSEEETHG